MEIIFVEGSTFLSGIIKKFTNSRYSHCAARYSSPDSQWIVHASIGGVQPDWWFSFSKRYLSMRRYLVLFSEGDQALDAVVKKIAHAPYDYGGLIGHGLSMVLGLKNNPFGNRKKYKCTELITEWHEECMKINKSLSIPFHNSELITPEFIIRLYDSRKDLFKLVE
jgi:hypothetical protein